MATRGSVNGGNPTAFVQALPPALEQVYGNAHQTLQQNFEHVGGAGEPNTYEANTTLDSALNVLHRALHSSELNFCLDEHDVEETWVVPTSEDDTEVSFFMDVDDDGEATVQEMQAFLCDEWEVELFYTSAIGLHSPLIPENINCNSSSTFHLRGCKPGFCSALGAVAKRQVTLEDLEKMSEAEKLALKRHDVGYKVGRKGVMPCNEGFFCPANLACMIPCPSGAYCPSPISEETLVEGVSLCHPYVYRADDALRGPWNNYTGCGGGDLWWRDGSGDTQPGNIFCPSGSFCPNVTAQEQCPVGKYCRRGESKPNPCPQYILTECHTGSDTVTGDYTEILIVLMLYAVFILLSQVTKAYQKWRWNLKGRAIKRAMGRVHEAHTQNLVSCPFPFSGRPPTPRNGEQVAASTCYPTRLSGHILSITAWMKNAVFGPRECCAGAVLDYDAYEQASRPLLEVEMEDVYDPIDDEDLSASRSADELSVAIPESNRQTSPHADVPVERPPEVGQGNGNQSTAQSKAASLHRRTMSSDYAWVLHQLRTDGLLNASNSFAPSAEHRHAGIAPMAGAHLLATVSNVSRSNDSLDASLRITGHDRSQYIKLDFEDLHVSLKSNGKVILPGVSGVFDVGTLSAVMGPSGSGKTVLMTTLAGRSNSATRVGGKVTINGEYSVNCFRNVTGFVPQDDVMHSILTVEENLWYSANYRLPCSVSLRQRLMLVERAMRVLGLDDVRHSIVGDVEKRGISGGQRKRVNIGMELVIDPLLVFLDEPTSGLDSTNSRHVVSALRYLAKRNVTVVVVLHQPSYSIFQMFSTLILLGKGGKMAYQGPVDEVEAYFGTLGYNVPPRMNPADYLLDIVMGAVLPVSPRLATNERAVRFEDDQEPMSSPGSRQNVDVFEYWAQRMGRAPDSDRRHIASSADWESNPQVCGASLRALNVSMWRYLVTSMYMFADSFLETIKALVYRTPNMTNVRPPGFFRQMLIIGHRVVNQSLREPGEAVSNYGITALTGLTLGLLDPQRELPSNISAMTYTIVAMGLLSMISVLSTFGGPEGLVFRRERSCGMNCFAYFVAKVRYLVADLKGWH